MTMHSTDGIGATSLHHVGIAVTDLDVALEHYLSVLGGTLELRRDVAEFGVEAACVELPASGPAAGGALIELLCPIDEASGIAKFLARRGEGMHHVCYAVADIQAALAACRARGIRLIDEQPRIGLHGSPVAFVHPAGMHGVLTELVQP